MCDNAQPGGRAQLALVAAHLRPLLTPNYRHTATLIL